MCGEAESAGAAPDISVVMCTTVGRVDDSPGAAVVRMFFTGAVAVAVLDAGNDGMVAAAAGPYVCT